MLPSPQVLARRADTPSPDVPDGRSSRLPTELIADEARRLTVFAAVGLALWSAAFLLDLLVLPAISGAWPRNWRIIPIETVGVIGSAVMWWYLHRTATSVENKGVIGMAVMLLHAALIAAANTWGMPAPASRPEDIGRPSWIALVILIYAMIAPSSPRRMLLASFVAASFDPLAYVIITVVGLPGPSLVQALALCWPSYACALIAVVPAKAIHRIGRRLREAQELGSYQLVEKLGQGGMGEVWRAQHRLLAREAAVKLVRPEVLGIADANDARQVLRRFEREAQATAALSSPHTIQVFDFGSTEDGTFYYVMELLSGMDLETLVREFGPLSADRTIFLLRQVCHSLADAHARGLVHRDIKPANIYVCRMGLDYDFVKVLDFGLVKVRGRGRDAETLTTIDHIASGTPAYMAPETILGDADVDRRADVYALGCVAYFALTGSLVFEAANSMQMFMQHLHAQPVRPSERSELPIPRELDDLVMACLQKDPAMRPQDAGELLGLAHGCHCAEGWNQTAATDWWKSHLPHLTGALAVHTHKETSSQAVSA